jgi:hypothetical protein
VPRQIGKFYFSKGLLYADGVDSFTEVIYNIHKSFVEILQKNKEANDGKEDVSKCCR